MILMANPSRRSSRAGFWTVLGLGALLLPLAPGPARTGTPEEPQSEDGKPVVSEGGRPVDPLLRPRADEMRYCASCHQPVSAPWRDLQRKPQSWKDAHDEAIRLMDEVRRLQARLGENANRLSPVDERDRGEEMERLKDGIELLKLKVQLKETRRHGTQVKLDEARRRLNNRMETNKHHPGAIPRDAIEEARMTEASLAADAGVEEIEWKEAVLQLKQAERRLARLQRTAEGTEGGGRAQQEKRLRELEKNVDILLKEIHKIREDMRPTKPRDTVPEHEETRGFIYRVWPTLDTTRLEDNIPKALKAFQKCKDIGDRISLQKLLKGTKGHADRLVKELALLHPEIVIDDEIQATKLKKVNEQIVKLGLDIEDYQKSYPDDK